MAGAGRRAGAWAVALSLLAAGTARGDPAVGAWSPEETWPTAPTHSVLLPTGKVLFLGEFDDGHHPHLFDPATGAVTPIHSPGYNAFCAGHSRLADGRILFAGGHTAEHVGVADAALFDPVAERWIPLPPMRDQRWYPTNTTLANGEVVVLSGEMNGAADLSVIPEIFDPESGTFRALENAPMRIPYYPRCFVAPDERLFCAGPQILSRWFDPTGEGRWTDGPRGLHGTATSRDYGSAAMLDSKVYLFGGDDPPTETNEVVDLAAATPRWEYVAPMSRPRRQHSAVILPDGKVLMVGGSHGPTFDDRTDPALVPELYDPVADTWTPLAPLARYHGYHSSGLLLPDGRVLAGGSRFDRTVQIFSPPYLFRGPRPRLTTVPASVEVGERFQVGTPDAAAVRSVVLIRAGAVTHAFDQDQRLVTLSFEASAGGLAVTAPATHALAPPGDYLLFAVSAEGVPSVGRFVRVGRPPSLPPGDEPIVGDPPPGGPDHGGHAAPSKGGGCASAGNGSFAALGGVALALLLASARRRAQLAPARR